MAVTVFFMIISLSTVFTLSSASLFAVKNAAQETRSKKTYYSAESGQEDALYRLLTNKQVPLSGTIFINGATTTTTVTDIADGKEIVSAGTTGTENRKVKTRITKSIGASFFYGVQTGQGGFLMENSSAVNGNLYANGKIEGDNTAVVRGDVVSAGPSGEVDGIHATSSVWAHNIKNSTIEKNAYYQTISNTTVSGTSYPGTQDQATTSLPISDAAIEEIKTAAASGGVHTSPCPYTISSDITIGPKKINCDLTIQGTPTVTLDGHLWVSGNIEIQNSAVIKAGSALGNESVAIIADNPSNRTTSSKIFLENSTQYLGSGATSSYVLMVSQNNSGENGGSEVAIDFKNSATGKLIVYAGHGIITLQNSSSLKEVTAYKIHLKNSSTVTYESGLNSLLFSSGPGGTWEVTSWTETQ